MSTPLPVKIGVGAVSLVALLILGSCGIHTVGQVIQPGDVGVKIKTIGSNAGVDPSPYPSGWQFKGLGERFVEFPVITRPYSYAVGKDAKDKDVNEEISFSDNNALPMTADVQITLAVNPVSAPLLYKTYRMGFDDMITGQIRNDVRSAIAAETELVPVEFLYKGGRQEVISKALARVQKVWAPQGVNVSKLEWIGNVRYPEVILEAIKAKTQADANATSAQAQVAVAKAQADTRIEQARGEAESTRLRAAAISTNPEIVQMNAVEKWDGHLPQYVGAGTPLPFINVK